MSIFTALFLTLGKAIGKKHFAQILAIFKKGKAFSPALVKKQLASLPKKVKDQISAEFIQIITKPKNVADLIKSFLTKPEAFSRALSSLQPSELKKLQALINNVVKKQTALERLKRGDKDKEVDDINLPVIVSSSWIAEIWFKGEANRPGQLWIRTHTGWEGNLRDRISFDTFLLMKGAIGRNGTGAGSKLWQREWARYRSAGVKRRGRKNVVFNL